MALPARWSDLVALASLALAALAGVALWSQLPAEMAVHFDASGTPDSYVSKRVDVLLAPVFVATAAFVAYAFYREGGL